MVAAGCGGTGRELEAYAGPAGLDGLDFVTRSITLDPRSGGPGPRVAEVPGGLVNAVGLPNPGLEHFLATELPWLVRAGARVHVSIAGATMGEYADLARRLSRAPGVAGLEVNVGAPDEVGAGLFEVREPFHSASVIAAVRREFPADRPVLAKLRPDVSRIVEGARSCHEAGATAVVVGNAVPAAFADGRAGGLSGPAIAPIALRCVAEVHRALPDVPTIGCGGVHDLRSANAYLDAGACAVQVGTALLHDPTTVARLRTGLPAAAHPSAPEETP
jgi:dihydroorotate dehydrogenase (NAD+) catalytic subunit